MFLIGERISGETMKIRLRMLYDRMAAAEYVDGNKTTMKRPRGTS